MFLNISYSKRHKKKSLTNFYIVRDSIEPSTYFVAMQKMMICLPLIGCYSFTTLMLLAFPFTSTMFSI